MLLNVLCYCCKNGCCIGIGILKTDSSANNNIVLCKSCDKSGYCIKVEHTEIITNHDVVFVVNKTREGYVFKYHYRIPVN